MKKKWIRKLCFGGFLSLLSLIMICFSILAKHAELYEKTSGDYIHWVDFGITAEAMYDALSLDLKSHDGEAPLDWIEALAYLGAKYGGSFSHYKKADLLAFAEKRQSGTPLAELTHALPYFDYFEEAYRSVLGGFVGDFYLNGEKRYGLIAFSPIASGYAYNHYDDFGASRSYGYKREHLGHDLMGGVGTPIIAIESGYIEAIGWNQYGGWRIGIRSFDNKRYYYYAHLRKDHPYAKDFREGDTVMAGDVIGYMGRTGYSVKENVNNIDRTHLHFGLQLIFDPSQKDGVNQIWIDLYEITKFLSRHRMSVVKSEDGRDYVAKDILLPEGYRD